MDGKRRPHNNAAVVYQIELKWRCVRYFHEEFTDPLLIAINDYRQTGQPAAVAVAAHPEAAATRGNRWLDRLTRLWLGGSIRDIENFESTVATRSSGEGLQYRGVPSEASEVRVRLLWADTLYQSTTPLAPLTRRFSVRIPPADFRRPGQAAAALCHSLGGGARQAGGGQRHARRVRHKPRPVFGYYDDMNSSQIKCEALGVSAGRETFVCLWRRCVDCSWL